MKLFSTNNPSEIRNLIDARRKDPALKAFERWREIGDIVLSDLKRKGKFLETQQGLFFFDNEQLRAFPLDANVGLGSIVQNRYGINANEYCFKLLLGRLQAEAFLHGHKMEVRRLAHYDREANRLYVSRFNGEMYRLDGHSVESVLNGTDNVIFFDDLAVWEPFSYIAGSTSGELNRQLIQSVNFSDSGLSVSEQQLLLKLWVLAVFFGNVQPTKIILLLLGDHGSGKTSALRRIQKLIFGRKVNLLSIEKDKQDGFIATITTDPIALFDNLDENISWLPPALSRLATGVTFSRRQLYTTNEKVEFPGVSWLGITSRTVRFMDNQPDLPDRTLVLKLARLVDRQPEEELLNAVAQRRNAMWSELLDELNAIVRYLKDNPEPVHVRFRMADFAAFALKIATLWGCRKEVEEAFAKLEGAQAELTLDKDPIHQVLEIWLAHEANHRRSLDAGTLHEEWDSLARKHHIGWPFGSGRSLGQTLGQLRFALGERFEVEVTFDGHSKQNRYAFSPKQSKPRSAQLVQPAEPEEVLEYAGFAGCWRH